MGIKYPYGDTPVYPPRDWTCPGCQKFHTKPHYAYPGQVDESLPIKAEGRVKFNREGSQMGCDDMKELDMPIKVMKEATGEQFKKNMTHRPLFCPHCGWVDTIICIVKSQKQKKRKYGVFGL